MDEMTNAHRQLLQAFMSRGIMDAKEVKNQFKHACERNQVEYDQSRIVEMITTINKPIKEMHLEIKKGVSEETGGHYYGLVNTVESDITKLSSLYSVAENEFFKKLIETIVDSDDGAVPSNTALNLVSSLPDGVKLTITDAENLVKKLKDDRWLSDSHGYISLSTRTILEMESYIKEQHGDSTIDCDMCKKLCLKGQTCGRCDLKLHFHCARTLFKNQPNPQCPKKNCGTEWPHAIPERPREPTASRPTDSTGSPMDEDRESRKRSHRR